MLAIPGASNSIDLNISDRCEKSPEYVPKNYFVSPYSIFANLFLISLYQRLLDILPWRVTRGPTPCDWCLR